MKAFELPVHCCCTPGLRLGFLAVPAPWARRPEVIVVSDGAIIRAPIREILLPVMRIEIIPIGLAGIYETSVPLSMRRLAIESADLSIEAWRRVPGFREAQKVYR